MHFVCRSGKWLQVKGVSEQSAFSLRVHWYMARVSDPSVTNSDWLYFWEGNAGRGMLVVLAKSPEVLKS